VRPCVKKDSNINNTNHFLLALQVLHSALFTFDLIESVLARVEELIEIKTKFTSEEDIGMK
jgi:hypothetical protein